MLLSIRILLVRFLSFVIIMISSAYHNKQNLSLINKDKDYFDNKYLLISNISLDKLIKILQTFLVFCNIYVILI